MSAALIRRPSTYVNPRYVVPVGSDLPENGGITGNLPAAPPVVISRPTLVRADNPPMLPDQAETPDAPVLGSEAIIHPTRPLVLPTTLPPEMLVSPAAPPDAETAVAEVPKTRREKAVDAFFAEKDRKIVDKDKNPFLNILKNMGLNALKAFNNSQGTGARFKDRLFSALGGGAAGGVMGAADGSLDEQFMHNRRLGKLGAEVDQATALEQQSQDLDKGAYNNAILAQRPVLDKQKANAATLRADSDKTYKENQITLGTKKANELKIYQDAIVDLREKGAAQNDKRITLLEKNLDERKRSNQETEKDKDLDREARIKVATIMSDTQIKTTGMRVQSTEGIAAANRDARASLQKYAQEHGREQTVTKAVASWVTSQQKANGRAPTTAEVQQYKKYVEGNLDDSSTDDQ